MFLCENNGWAISTPQRKQMANEHIAERAAGYGMEGVTGDGFDPVAVYDAVRAARAKAVNGGGPTLIEAKCYRFLSHTTDDDDRTYRPREDVEKERTNDPLPRFEERFGLTRSHVDFTRLGLDQRVRLRCRQFRKSGLIEQAGNEIAVGLGHRFLEVEFAAAHVLMF